MSLGRFCSSHSRPFILRSYSPFITTLHNASTSQRKVVFDSLLVEPQALQGIKEYRYAAEWHIFKRRFEKPLLEAFQTYLREAEEQKHTAKRQKRLERKEQIADIRKKNYLNTLREQAAWREAFVTKTWEKNAREMKDTLDWSILKNPVGGRIDSQNQDLSKFCKPETLLPLESWIFFNREHWKDIPFLSNIAHPLENNLSWLIGETAPRNPDLIASDTEEDDFLYTQDTNSKNDGENDSNKKSKPVELNAKMAKKVLQSISTQNINPDNLDPQSCWLGYASLGEDEPEPPKPDNSVYGVTVNQPSNNHLNQTFPSPTNPTDSDSDWFMPKPLPGPISKLVGHEPMDPDEHLKRIVESSLESGERSSDPDSSAFYTSDDPGAIVKLKRYCPPQPEPTPSPLDMVLESESVFENLESNVLRYVEQNFNEDQEIPENQNFWNMLQNISNTIEELNKKNDVPKDILALKKQLAEKIGYDQHQVNAQRQWTTDLLELIRKEVLRDAEQARTTHLGSRKLILSQLLESKLLKYGFIGQIDYLTLHPPEQKHRIVVEREGEEAKVVGEEESEYFSEQEGEEGEEGEEGLGEEGEEGEYVSEQGEEGEYTSEQEGEESNYSTEQEGEESVYSTEQEGEESDYSTEQEGEESDYSTEQGEESNYSTEDRSVDTGDESAIESSMEELQRSAQIKVTDIYERDPNNVLFGAPGFPTLYAKSLLADSPEALKEAQGFEIPKIPPLDFEAIQQGSNSTDCLIEVDTNFDDLPKQTLLYPDLQQMYTEAKDLESSLPTNEEIEHLFKIASPDYINNVIKGAKRAGIDEKHIEFLKAHAFAQLPSKENIAKIKAYLQNYEEIHKFISHAYQLAGENSNKQEQNSNPLFSTKVTPTYDTEVEEALRNANSPQERKMIAELAQSGAYKKSNTDNIHGNLVVSDEESEEDENLNMETSESTATYFINYAINLKQHLEYQMKEQLQKFGLLDDIQTPVTQQKIFYYDPPALGKDVEPCVEIVHTTHIQSITGYAALTHVQRKVVFKINVSMLNLPEPVVKRLHQIVGPRYNPETGILKYVSDSQPNKHQNTIFGFNQLQKIFEAAFLAYPFYIPLSDIHQDPSDTLGDCPIPVKKLTMPTVPEIKEYPWIKEKKLKPLPPHILFRTFPFGWSQKQRIESLSQQ